MIDEELDAALGNLCDAVQSAECAKLLTDLAPKVQLALNAAFKEGWEDSKLMMDMMTCGECHYSLCQGLCPNCDY